MVHPLTRKLVHLFVRLRRYDLFLYLLSVFQAQIVLFGKIYDRSIVPPLMDAPSMSFKEK